MKKFKYGTGIAILFVLAMDRLTVFLMKYIGRIPHDLHDIDYDDDFFHEHLSEHEEAAQMEKMGANTVPVHLQYINFGDLAMHCPECGEATDQIAVGIGIAEDTETEEASEFNELQSIGVIAYPCDHSVYSLDLTDKIANILNAGENGLLTPELFVDLAYCEEHGEQNGTT